MGRMRMKAKEIERYRHKRLYSHRLRNKERGRKRENKKIGIRESVKLDHLLMKINTKWKGKGRKRERKDK